MNDASGPVLKQRIAEVYKSNQLQPDHDLVQRRSTASGVLLKKLTADQIPSLVRLALDLPESPPSSLDWFVACFNGGDASFTRADNNREGVFLAALVLEQLFESGTDLAIYAAASLLAASVGPGRHIKGGSGLASLAQRSLAREQQERRLLGRLVDLNTDALADGEEDEDLQTLAANNDLPKIAKKISAIIKHEMEVAEAIKCLDGNTRLVNEELQMLWWFLGGTSRDRNTRFSEMGVWAASIIAGKELGDLAHLSCGPLAAPALLDLMLTKLGTGKTEEAGWSVAVGKVPIEWRRSSVGFCGREDMADICPLTTALVESAAANDSEEWKVICQRKAQFDLDARAAPLDLAMQSYRERLLLRSISK